MLCNIYTEKNANMYCKWSHKSGNMKGQYKLFALNIISKYVTSVILLVLPEISTLYGFFDVSFSKIMILES